MSTDLSITNYLPNDNWVNIFEMTSLEDWKIYRQINKIAIQQIEIVATRLLICLECRVTCDAKSMTYDSFKRVIGLNDLMNGWATLFKQNPDTNPFNIAPNLKGLILRSKEECSAIRQLTESSTLKFSISRQFFNLASLQHLTPFSTFTSSLLSVHREFSHLSWEETKKAQTDIYIISLVIFNLSPAWFPDHPALDDLWEIKKSNNLLTLIETKDETSFKRVLKQTPLNQENLEIYLTHTLDNFNFKFFELLHAYYINNKEEFTKPKILNNIFTENLNDASSCFIEYIFLKNTLQTDGFSIKNNQLNTPLIQLIKDKEDLLAKNLVLKGIDVNEFSPIYITALWAALFTSNLDLVKFLVEKGANLDQRYWSDWNVFDQGLRVFKGDEAKEFIDYFSPKFTFFDHFKALFNQFYFQPLSFSTLLLMEAIFKKIVIKIHLIANSIFTRMVNSF